MHYSYSLTPNGTLFKIHGNGFFRSYNLACVTRAVWQDGAFSLYFGEDGDAFKEQGPAAEALKDFYCRYAGLHSEQLATLTVTDGKVEAKN